MSLVVGSRYTSDDSPTVTQTYLFSVILSLCLVYQTDKTNTMEELPGQRLIATPAIRTFKNMYFHHKINKQRHTLQVTYDPLIFEKSLFWGKKTLP